MWLLANHPDNVNLSFLFSSFFSLGRHSLLLVTKSKSNRAVRKPDNVEETGVDESVCSMDGPSGVHHHPATAQLTQQQSNPGEPADLTDITPLPMPTNKNLTKFWWRFTHRLTNQHYRRSASVGLPCCDMINSCLSILIGWKLVNILAATTTTISTFSHSIATPQTGIPLL